MAWGDIDWGDFIWGDFGSGGFCPRGILSGGILTGGVLSRGILSGGILSCHRPIILGILALMDSCLRGSCHSGSYPQLIVSAVAVLGVVVLYPPFTKSSLTPSSWI